MVKLEQFNLQDLYLMDLEITVKEEICEKIDNYIKKELFIKIGMFDEKILPISYNDVDLCLRLSNDGYFNVWTPFVEAYHYESISRGYDSNVKTITLRESEKYNLRIKHKNFLDNIDPYYNKNLSEFSQDFSQNFSKI